MHYILTEDDKKAIAAAKVIIDCCNKNKVCAYCVFSATNRPCLFRDEYYDEIHQLAPYFACLENSTLESVSNIPTSVKEQEIKRMEHKKND